MDFLRATPSGRPIHPTPIVGVLGVLHDVNTRVPMGFSADGDVLLLLGLMRFGFRKLEAKPKHVVSTTRRDFPWSNTFRVDGDLRQAIAALKRRTPRGLLVGSPALSAALEQLGLIDEYRLAVHPVLAGHGPTLFAGLSLSSRLTLLDARRLKSGVMALHYRRR